MYVKQAYTTIIPVDRQYACMQSTRSPTSHAWHQLTTSHHQPRPRSKQAAGGVLLQQLASQDRIMGHHHHHHQITR